MASLMLKYQYVCSVNLFLTVKLSKDHQDLCYAGYLKPWEFARSAQKVRCGWSQTKSEFENSYWRETI